MDNNVATRYQGGFLNTLAITFFLAFISFAMFQFQELIQTQNERNRANDVGSQISTYQGAVQRFVSYNNHGGTLATPTSLIDNLNTNSNLSLATAVTFNGTFWLKKNVVGVCDAGLQGTGIFTANQSFISCLFRNQTNFRQKYVTKIWFDTANGTIEAQTTIPAYNLGGKIRKDFSSLVANAAKANIYGSFTSDDALSIIEFDKVSGNIIMRVSNNSAVSSWIKTNGQNSMQADLSIGGYSIVNADNGDFSGTLTAGSVDVINNVNVGTSLSVVEDIITSSGNIVANAGKVITRDGLEIIGTGDLVIEDGRIILKNATPGVDYIGADGVKKAEITLESDNEMALQFDGGTGLLFIDGDTYNADIQRYASQAVYDVSIVANGSTVIKPICPIGKTPQLFLSASAFSRNDTVKPIGALSTYAIDNGASWSPYLEFLDEDGVHGGISNTNGSFPNISILAVSKCT